MKELRELLIGAYDLHIHCGPDVVARKVDDLEMAQRAEKAGMKGFAIKSHYTATSERAALARKLCPSVNAVGSVTLNASVGGVNPSAVETAARLGAKIVWCPTFDSASQQNYYLKNLPQYVVMQDKLNKQGIQVPSYVLCDQEGNLTNEMSEVFDLVQEYDMMLGTGHITHEETFAVAREANRRQFHKLVVTHCDWEFTAYTPEEQEELARLGAVLEHTYTSPFIGKVTWDEMAEQIRRIGAEHIILSTDLGQAKNVYPDEGLLDFYRILTEKGITEEEIRRMGSINPAELVE